MNIAKIYYSSHFEKAFKVLPESIKKKAISKESIFRKNCFNPALKTHKLKGELSDVWAFSVNYYYRILFEFRDHGIVIFDDIGPHSVYK